MRRQQVLRSEIHWRQSINFFIKILNRRLWPFAALGFSALCEFTILPLKGGFQKKKNTRKLILEDSNQAFLTLQTLTLTN